jgi:hypothetical protein
MVGHFRRMADETGMPIIIYNVVPWSYLSPALLTRIMNEVLLVVGVKQSAGDLKLFADLMMMAPDKLIYSAVDALMYPFADHDVVVDRVDEPIAIPPVAGGICIAFTQGSGLRIPRIGVPGRIFIRKVLQVEAGPGRPLGKIAWRMSVWQSKQSQVAR